MYALFRRKLFAQKITEYTKNKALIDESSGIILIKPSMKLPISTLDNHREDIKKTIEIGYRDLVNNQRVKVLFDNNS